MISKQEWFEKYKVNTGMSNLIENMFRSDMDIAQQLEQWQKTRLICIKMALEELQSRQRKVIVFLFFGELPIGEIAQKMKLSPQAISNIKKRAIQNLRHNVLVRFFLKNPV